MRTKEVKGITLVALAVTIVVLLILAGVTISSVFGENGLINISKQKTASVKEKNANEEVKRLVMEYKVGNNGESLEDYLKVRVPDRVDEVTRVDDNTLKVKKDGYEIIVDEEKQEGKLVLSETSGNYTYPISGTFSVLESTGELSVESSNNNIATVNISGKEITVMPGTTEGIATITVTSGATKDYRIKTATYEATVQNGTIILSATPYSGTYDGQAHNAITQVDVNPSDAKLEYSLDGNTYSETMPTITNTSSFTVTVKASKAGYKTQTTTETVKVNKANGNLTLSSSSGTLTYPNSTTFTVSNNTGSLSASSSNSNIASASISGNIVTVKSGTTAGTATITVTSAEATNYNAKSATYTATVNNGTISLSATPYTGTYDGKAHNALTNVTVNPSDAKLEYSTNGTSYSTTMPTITNTSSFTVTVRASKVGYKTQTTTQTTKVNKANGNLTLSATSGTITYPNSTSFTVSNNTGSLSVSSSNSNIASASISGNTVTVKSVGAGNATITVKSATSTNYNEKTATYNIKVNYQTFTGDSGAGYYADVDGNGTVDGIIYADLKKEESGKWGLFCTYKLPAVSNTKNYYISKVNYKGPFGTKNVLSPTGSGNARFYVMALSDYNNGTEYTYENAKNITSGEWRLPTTNEWIACAGKLNINIPNHSEYGLKSGYWTSSKYVYIGFDPCKTFSGNSWDSEPVRLTRTF